MELDSQPKDSTDHRLFLEGQLRESFGRIVYSHKTQEKCGDILLGCLARIKLVQILLPAISTGGFISVFFGTGTTGSMIGAICSAILLALNLYTKEYDLGELAQKHRHAANEIWYIRERYFSLLTDLSVGKPLETIQQERDDLLMQLKSVYSTVPSTTSRAYRKAQRALKQDEEMTFSDGEIDAFLPKELRRS